MMLLVAPTALERLTTLVVPASELALALAVICLLYLKDLLIGKRHLLHGDRLYRTSCQNKFHEGSFDIKCLSTYIRDLAQFVVAMREVTFLAKVTLSLLVKVAAPLRLVLLVHSGGIHFIY